MQNGNSSAFMIDHPRIDVKDNQNLKGGEANKDAIYANTPDQSKSSVDTIKDLRPATPTRIFRIHGQRTKSLDQNIKNCNSK